MPCAVYGKIKHNVVNLDSIGSGNLAITWTNDDPGSMMPYSDIQFYHDMQISWPDSGSPPIRLPDS